MPPSFLDRFVFPLVSRGLAKNLQLYRRVVFNEAVPDTQKNKIVMIFSEMDKRLVDGADEHLSLLDLALRISGILSA